MRRIRYIGLLLLTSLVFALTIQSCAASQRRKRARKHKKTYRTTQTQTKELATLQTNGQWSNMVGELINYGETLLGKPYRYRGVAPWALDCSGYVSFLYSRLGIKIPHSSGGLSTYTKKISEPKPGDLAFFKGRNSRSGRVGHVALVVENKDGEITIMHSTNSRGIIKHKLKNDAYFARRFLHFGRLPEVSQLINQGQTPNLLTLDSLQR